MLVGILIIVDYTPSWNDFSIYFQFFTPGKRRSSGGHPRREESSISFRHFLQSEAGHSSNTTYPDLYSCSRQEGPLVDGSIVDPESPDLPDFVQDHLALENTYFNDGTNLKSVNVHNLPDFAPCLLRDENSEPHLYQRPGNEIFLLKFTINHYFMSVVVT